MMTPRIPGLRPGDLNAAQTEVYHAIAGGPRAGGPFALTDADGCLRGPFNAMLLSPPVGAALQAVGAAVRYQSALTDRVREMAILVVAWHWGSRFELEAHEAVGRVVGLTDPEVAALRRGTLPDLTDVSEQVAVRTVAVLTRGGQPYRHGIWRCGARAGRAGTVRSDNAGGLLRDAGPATQGVCG